MARVRVTINQAEYRRLTQARSGPVVRHADRISRRVVNQAKRNARVDEGQGRASIHHTIDVHATRVISRIGSPLTYMYWQHEGTGLFGPKRRRITPVRAKFLRFEVKSGKAAKGSRPVIFATSVAGVKGDKWLVRAFKAVSPYPVRER